jgi:hypothetical protein
MTMLPKLQNANICELILKLRVWTFARLNFYSEFMKSCSLTQKNKVQSRVNRGRDSKQTRKSDSRKTQWIIASKKQRTTHKRLDLQELLIEIPNLTHCNQVYRASIMSILLCCHVVLFLFFLVQVFTYFFTDWFLLFWKKIHERVWPCVATFSENWFWSESQPQLRGPRNHVAIDVLLPSHDYTDFAHANVLASNKLLHWSFTLSRCACLRWLECSTSSPIPRGKKCKVKKNMLT